MSNARSPDANNYTLGRGVIYFDQFVSDAPTGRSLDLGNAPAFNIAVEVESLEHFSSRAGLRAKDKEVISQLTPTITFTLDEINEETLRLLFMADIQSDLSQSAADITGAVTGHKNRVFDLGHRAIGCWTIPMDNVSGVFQEDETVTGGTSAATANVIRVEANRLVVNTVSGTFADDEQITGGISVATADVNSSAGQVFDATDIVLLEASTQLVKGTDFQVQDAKAGLVKVLEGYTGTAEASLTYKGSRSAVTYSQLDGFAQTEVEGELRFMGDPPVGTRIEVKAWRVNLRPDGETAFIGDDWSTLSFTGEILKDEASHPDNPYMEVVLPD